MLTAPQAPHLDRKSAEALYASLYAQLNPSKKRSFDAYLISEGGPYDRPYTQMSDEILSDVLQVVDDMVTGGDMYRNYKIIR